MRYLKIFFSGICVGAADIVPGISGGTVAFISGIYEELLKSIASLNRRALSQLFTLQIGRFFESVAWKFLLAFLLGVSCSFVTLAKGVTLLLADATFRPLLYSAFMGLVVGSVIFCARLLPKFDVKTVSFLVAGAIFASFLSGTDLAPKKSETTFDVPIASQESFSSCDNFDPKTQRLLGVSPSEVPLMLAKKYITPDTEMYRSDDKRSLRAKESIRTSATCVVDLWVIFCGMIAISAMLLPGISGSYLLNILGMYGFVLGALVDWLEGVKNGIFDWASFGVVLSMGIGITCGALFFSRVVSFLLERYRAHTLSCLTGFMIGALKAVWPFWTITYKLSPAHLSDGPMLHVLEPVWPCLFSIQFFFSCCCFLLGISCVLLVEYIGDKKHEAATSGV